ncbi:hypothetical protein Hanom_Chr03g00252391 [Helianthus anomalus]
MDSYLRGLYIDYSVDLGFKKARLRREAIKAVCKTPYMKRAEGGIFRPRLDTYSIRMVHPTVTTAAKL